MAKPKLPSTNTELEVLIRESATKRRGRPPGSVPPLTQKQHQANRKARLEQAGGRVVSVGFGPAAAAAVDKLKADLDLGSDRAAVEVAVLFCMRPAVLPALVRLIGRKVAAP